MSTTDKLLRDILAWCKREGLAPSEFGYMAVGDRAFVTHLKRGRQPRADTLDRVRAWMRENAGGKWRPSRAA